MSQLTFQKTPQNWTRHFNYIYYTDKFNNKTRLFYQSAIKVKPIYGYVFPQDYYNMDIMLYLVETLWGIAIAALRYSRGCGVFWKQ